MRQLKIAMVGLRGLPATYGGIERHVEEIGARLVDRGHSVTAFVRPDYSAGTTSHRGVRCVSLPTVKEKHLEATVHSAVASLATVGRGYDIVHFHALGPGLFSPIPKYLTRAKVVQTIHGLDDQRGKWGGGAQKVLRLARATSTRVPDELVVVSRELQRVYREEHTRDSVYIPNGHPEPRRMPAGPVLDRLGLEPKGYLLFLGRLVPEKDPLGLIEAFASVETNLKLVIVGGSSNTDEYVGRLHRAAERDPRVVMPGYLFGDELAEVMTHAQVFVQPSLLEGLPITMLEAAAYGLPVVASDIPAHREIIIMDGPGRRTFSAGDPLSLSEALRAELSDPLGGSLGASSLTAEVAAHYNWDKATDALEDLYYQQVGLPSLVRPARVSQDQAPAPHPTVPETHTQPSTDAVGA